ncbi:TIGR03013 family XrtA/PEP-CTERM system glycosyltransferase [Noviherbaspirillum cavernae]|uniref:TIGR03013 family XrtA/PEP-CTERM system glycosyltransferase n=1 Tax=Noviherbaspirillum cavernae TaxID=2320862 RepID=UPI001F5BEA3E|nr:TIGR03013 family XrtA/PEP-CTERM system glycosyltransferase [Noviherbaspirillum cavernae]
MAILIASVYLGAGIRFHGATMRYIGTQSNSFFLSACAFAMVIVFSMSALGMYQANFREGLRNTLLRLMPSFALGIGLITLIFYLIPELYFGRGLLGLVIVISAFGILIARVLVFKSSESGLLVSRILFLGSGPLAKECHDLAINNIAYHKYDIVGFVPTPNEECQVPAWAILSADESLLSIANRHNASEVVVSVRDRRGGSFPIDDLLECKLNGIKVTDAPAFFEREACQIRVDFLQPSWLIFGSGFDQSFLRAFGKRSFDLLVSMLLFIVALPVMLITGLFIFLEDRGPIFYRQERVGKDGHTYMVMKFRSMRNDAESGGKPQWAKTNDPRTTKVGSFIRMARIDELPQILNVLKGEMSFVGPRPERPFFVQQLCKEIPFYNMRHSIKPGITGMAQVRYQYGASVEDAVQKLQYDLYYVKNNSLFLDILILIDTLQVVLLGKGAR